MKTSKVKVLVYECKKCHASFNFLSDRELKTKCKVCGNELIFSSERDYNPKSGLSAVKSSRKTTTSSTYNSALNKQPQPTVECPYCHSQNTEKITNASKAINTVVWGIFGTKRHKNYHCNNCKSDF